MSTIDAFDYKAYTINLTTQAWDFLKQDESEVSITKLTHQEKIYIIENIKKFAFQAGNSLNKLENKTLNEYEWMLIIQFISEWIFHKTIEIIYCKIPKEAADDILENITENIIDICLTCENKINTDMEICDNKDLLDLIDLVEDRVNETYYNKIQEFSDKNIISREQADKAFNTSNIKYYEQRTLTNEKKSFSLKNFIDTLKKIG